MAADVVSSTSPLRQIMRSLSNREKMSSIRRNVLVWFVFKDYRDVVPSCAGCAYMYAILHPNKLSAKFNPMFE